jgi:hypothetical protein
MTQHDVPFLSELREELRRVAYEHSDAPVRVHDGARSQGPRRRPLRRLRSLSLAARVAVALVSLSVFAGVAVAAYVVFAGGAALELPSFDCQIAAHVATSTPAITGSPLVDCAAAWPQATGGQQAAPPLAIWGADDGQRLVAVASPVSAGPPADRDHFHWRRLPDTWTVDLPVVALNDQLNNISLPFNPGITSTCSYGGADIAAVRSLLHADGLYDWHVTLQAQNGQLSTGCQIVIAANVDAQNRTVELVQAPPQASSIPTTTSGTNPAAAVTTTVTTGTVPSTSTATTSTGPTTSAATSGTTPANDTTTVASPTLSDRYAQSLAHEAQLAQAQLQQLYTTVNAKLSANCESVADAAALWTQTAKTEGFTPATLAFWRQANDGKRLDPSAFPRHYTLYEQPASQNTGMCAHVLVMVVPGSGLANVYAARIAP